MIRTQVYIPDQLMMRARAIVQATGLNISELLREGLEIAITKRAAQHASSMQGLVGMFGKGKPTTMATEVDDIYQLYDDHLDPEALSNPITKVT